MISFLTFLAAATVAVVAITLIASRYYHDGVFGRLGLSMIAVGAGLGIVLPDIIEFVEGTYNYHRVSASGLCILVGLALFLMRHLYRFWRFCAHCEYNEASTPKREYVSKFSREL